MDHREHYRIDAEEFDYFNPGALTADELRRREIMLGLCPPRPGETLLEVGSGSGWYAIAQARRGVRVTALDLSERNLTRIRDLEPRVETVSGDALEPPLNGRRFDRIVAFEVLEHIPDPALALAAWKSLLAPGGRLVIAVPDRENIASTLCIHCNRKTPLNAHLHSFSAGSLRKLLRAGGYHVVHAERFLNPQLIHFRINHLLQWVPFPLWKRLDRLAVRIADRARFLTVIASHGGHP